MSEDKRVKTVNELIDAFDRNEYEYMSELLVKAYDSGRLAGASEERAAVVKWMRERGPRPTMSVYAIAAMEAENARLRERPWERLAELGWKVLGPEERIAECWQLTNRCEALERQVAGMREALEAADADFARSCVCSSFAVGCIPCQARKRIDATLATTPPKESRDE